MAVQLTGYQGPRGFKAEQVYDPSAQMMQQAKQDAQYREDAFASYKEGVQRLGEDIAKNQENDLRALSSFSDTLSTFLVDYQKKQNDKEYKLGLAEVMNGNATFPEQTFQKHNAEVSTLEAAANADGEVANSIADPELATTFRKESKAISGWRAYGQAVGTAKKAALETPGLLTAFMARTEKIVPTPDGPKSPVEIANNGTPAEIDAALAIGQQEIFQKKGLYNINPIILAEEFAPTFQAAKAQAKSNAISTVTANQRETTVYEVSNQLKYDVNAENVTTDQLGASYQQGVNRLMSEGGLSRGKAADAALAAQLEAIKALPPDEAKVVLERLKAVPKSVDDPKMGTLGSLHATMFQEAEDAIDRREDYIENQQRQEDNRRVESIVANLNNVRANATSEAEVLEAQRAADTALTALSRAGVTSATVALTQIRDKNSEFNSAEVATYNNARNKAETTGLTTDEIDALDLPEVKKNDLKKIASDRDRKFFESEYGSSIKAASQDKAETLAGLEFTEIGKPKNSPEVFNAYNQSVEDKMFGWYENFKKENKRLPSATEVQSQLEVISNEELSRYYDPKTQKPRPLPKSVTTFTNAKGEKIYDLSRIPPDQIDGRYAHGDISITLTKEETLANLERYSNGARFTERARHPNVISNQDPVDYLFAQARHHGIDPSPYVSSPRYQSELDNKAAAPRAASRYYSAENDLEQLRQAERLAQARERQAHYQRQSELAGKKVTAPADGMTAMPDTDIMQLALNQGLSEKQAVIMTAIALAESAGKPGNHNFNVSTGDESYGLWQINMLGALGPDRRRALGLTDNMQLADPETNARAMKYVLQSGYNAWTVYRTGAYRQYLPAAYRALKTLQSQQ